MKREGDFADVKTDLSPYLDLLWMFEVIIISFISYNILAVISEDTFQYLSRILEIR